MSKHTTHLIAMVYGYAYSSHRGSSHHHNTTKLAFPTLCLLSFLIMGLSTPLEVNAQCNGQDALNCNCEQTTNYDVAVCIDGTTATVTLKVCNQFPNPSLIRNPCTNCTEPLNSITYVKEICVPQEFSTRTYAELMPGIICATNLCRSPNLLGIVLPLCTPSWQLACTTTNPYCHVLSLPRCVRREGNCWVSCNDGCDNRCMVWRQYCRTVGPSGCWNCSTTTTCVFNPSDVCPDGCQLLQDCPSPHILTCCN